MLRKKNVNKLCLSGCCVLAVLGLATCSRHVEVEAAMGTPVLMAGEDQTVYLRVKLHGFDMGGGEGHPLNVAIVLDRSTSMIGEKIDEAKEAVISLIDSLDDRDVVSVITFATTAEVLVSATTAMHRKGIKDKVRQVSAFGRSALFPGVTLAVAELRKCLDLQRANGIVLVSDGLPNVGPASVEAFRALAESLQHAAIDLNVVRLGGDFDRNVAAVQDPGGSWPFDDDFNRVGGGCHEIRDGIRAVAENATIRFSCAEDVRPVCALGGDGAIDGKDVNVELGKVFGHLDKSVLVEVEIPAGLPGVERVVGEVFVTYDNLITKSVEEYHEELSVRFTANREEVAKNVNKRVMVSVVRDIGFVTEEERRKSREDSQESIGVPWFVDGQREHPWENVLEKEVDMVNEELDLDPASAQNRGASTQKKQNEVVIDEETKAQLRALGYVSGQEDE